MSAAEDALEFQLKAAGIWDGWEREFRFHPTRRWRFDFAHPASKLGVEVDGGQYIRGRHNRPAGVEGDNEKLNAAVQLRWFNMRFTPKQVKEGEALLAIEGWIKSWENGWIDGD